jgi:hypothetical protein
VILKHVWGILSDTRATWEKIRQEDRSVVETYVGTIIPLALISPVAGLIGTTQFGWQIGPGKAVTLTTGSAIQISIAYFGAILVSVFVIAMLIRWMSETYGEQKSLPRCLALAAYTAVPLFLVGVFQIYPVLWINFLFGLPALAFSVYLLYSGVPVMMEIPPEKGFLFSSAVLAVGLVALVGLLVSTVVLWSYGLGPAFMSG